MLSVELLPAAHGDAIWIEYGAKAPLRRVLIDGGPAPTYASALRKRIGQLAENDRAFELIVVTHIDADHIDGALILLQEFAQLKLSTNEIWFNGWTQLPKSDRDTYAPLQGEFLGGLIEVDDKLKRVWNKHFNHGAVVARETGALEEIVLADEGKITLLGPTLAELKRLRARWVSAIRDFSPGDAGEAVRRLRERREYRPPATPAVFGARDYGDDRSPANGSSIAFVFEYGGAAILFAGDAHARTLAASLTRLAQQRGGQKIRFDAVKLPHHGSMGNVSDEWVGLVDSAQWLISTNGALFDHPDVKTAELISRHCQTPKMLCNYRSPSTERLKADEGGRWVTVFPEPGVNQGPAGGLALNWNGTGGAPARAASRKRRRP
jgi:beta-lactamase superfamily II metal-dependent hydrolase